MSLLSLEGHKNKLFCDCWLQVGLMWSWKYSSVAGAEWDSALLSGQPRWIPFNGLHWCGFWGVKLFWQVLWWSNSVSEQVSPFWIFSSLKKKLFFIWILWKCLFIHIKLVIFFCNRFASSRSGHIFEIDYSRVAIKNVRRLLPAQQQHGERREKWTFNTGRSIIKPDNVPVTEYF